MTKNQFWKGSTFFVLFSFDLTQNEIDPNKSKIAKLSHPQANETQRCDFVIMPSKKVQEIGFSTVRMKLATKDNKIAKAASHMTIKHTDSYL